MTPQQLRALRESLRFDQFDFAKILGVSPWTYIRWESLSGKGPPKNRVKQIEDFVKDKKEEK